jgi:hypothetical protein
MFVSYLCAYQNQGKTLFLDNDPLPKDVTFVVGA